MNLTGSDAEKSSEKIKTVTQDSGEASKILLLTSKEDITEIISENKTSSSGNWTEVKLEQSGAQHRRSDDSSRSRRYHDDDTKHRMENQTEKDERRKSDRKHDTDYGKKYREDDTERKSDRKVCDDQKNRKDDKKRDGIHREDGERKSERDSDRKRERDSDRKHGSKRDKHHHSDTGNERISSKHKHDDKVAEVLEPVEIAQEIDDIPLRKDYISDKNIKDTSTTDPPVEKGGIDALEKEKPCLYSPSFPSNDSGLPLVEKKVSPPSKRRSSPMDTKEVKVENDLISQATTKPAISSPVKVSMVPKQVLKPSKGLSFIAEAFGDVEKTIQQKLSTAEPKESKPLMSPAEVADAKVVKKKRRSKWDVDARGDKVDSVCTVVGEDGITPAEASSDGQVTTKPNVSIVNVTIKDEQASKKLEQPVNETQCKVAECKFIHDFYQLLLQKFVFFLRVEN